MFIELLGLLLLIAVCLFGGAFLALFVVATYQVSEAESREDEEERGGGGVD